MARGQKEDSLSQPPRRKLINTHDIFNQAIHSISRNPADTIDGSAVLLAKSEEAYFRYAGRYIRHIFISQFGFEQKLTDTTSRLVTAGTKIYNKLHVNTKDWVIRDNLFIHRGDEVNPYKIADNERYLRTIGFIQDVRILLKPVKNHSDSVDVIVVSKDLFSITGDLSTNGLARVESYIADANFLGMGQRIQFGTLYDQDRTPKLGYSFLYSKQSIGGSFINGTVAYTQINTGSSLGKEDESAYFLRLNRPLMSPYARFAGGLELSQNGSQNIHLHPDSSFYSYDYSIVDGWLGYNLNSGKLRHHFVTPIQERNRIFISGRYFNINFENYPFQIGTQFDPFYNSRTGFLGNVTFFRQDYFKTQYIYGFGTTEDLPYGYNIAATAGWVRQKDLDRPYTGVVANQYIASGAGEFYQFFAESGGYYHDGQIQDAIVLLGGSVFSRLHQYRRNKIREYFRFSYTRQFNRLTDQALRIDNQYGLNDFGTDSVLGQQRMNFYAEPIVFTPYKILGFRLAPFAYANGVLITPEDQPLKKSDFYTNIGCGIRTRNENLIFGTVEFRFIYIPRTAYGVNGLRVTVNGNLSFRYQSTYVKAPEVIRYNDNVYIY